MEVIGSAWIFGILSGLALGFLIFFVSKFAHAQFIRPEGVQKSGILLYTLLLLSKLFLSLGISYVIIHFYAQMLIGYVIGLVAMYFFMILHTYIVSIKCNKI